MEKYYTPEITEFFVGFEYERFVPRSNATEEECWEKLEMSVNYLSLDDIDDEIIEKEIKVKYLDKEDIESLGFIYKGVNAFGGLSFEKIKPVFGFNNTEFTKIVLNQNTGVTIEQKIESGYDNSWCTKFEGTIKNKSELVKLLKQLNIE